MLWPDTYTVLVNKYLICIVQIVWRKSPKYLGGILQCNIGLFIVELCRRESAAIGVSVCTSADRR